MNGAFLQLIRFKMLYWEKYFAGKDQLTIGIQIDKQQPKPSIKGGRPMCIKHFVSILCSSAVGLLLFAGCSESPSGPDMSSGQTKLFIAESDFQSGLLEWMSIENNIVSSQGLSIYSDAGVHSFGGYLYVLERFGADNVMKFDPSKNDQSGVVYQKHLGDNWNPSDIEFLSATKAYVSNMNEPKITVFNPSSSEVLQNIDISTYTFRPDSNVSPYANDMVLVGSDLYVMLQRRNGYKPGAPTLILKVNTSTDAVTDTVPCQFTNGYGMAYCDGVLYVSNPGSGYSLGDGAIEAVTLATKQVRTVIDETALGGNPNQIVHKSGTHFYVQNYIGWKNVKVVEIDAATGSIVETLPDIKDAFGGICYDSTDNRLYVGERDSVEMGIRIFENNQQVGSTVKSANSLPPIGMVVVR